MIKRPQLDIRNLVPLTEAQASAVYDVNTKVSFYDCHPKQPDWLKQLFVVSGVVRKTLWDTEKQETAYQLYLPANRRTLYVYESELVDNCVDTLMPCPWGQVESTMLDGLMIKVGDELEPKAILDDAVKALKLDATDYMKHKRRIHVLFKSAKSVVRVSYDREPEFRVFAKKASYDEAAKALLM